MKSALRPLERYTLCSKVSIHEAPAALHDMAFTQQLLTIDEKVAPLPSRCRPRPSRPHPPEVLDLNLNHFAFVVGR